MSPFERRKNSFRSKTASKGVKKFSLFSFVVPVVLLFFQNIFLWISVFSAFLDDVTIHRF